MPRITGTARASEPATQAGSEPRAWHCQGRTGTQGCHVKSLSCSERPRAAPAAAVRGTGRMLMPLNHDNDPGPVIPPAVGSTTSWRWMMTPAWLCRIDSVMPAPDNMIQVFTIL